MEMDWDLGDAPATRWSRLRTTRLAVVTLLLVVIVLPGLTGGIAYWRSRTVIVAGVEAGQKAAADAIVDAMSWALDMATAAAENTAADESLHLAVDNGDIERIEARLRAAHSALPLFRSLAVVDGAGAAIATWPRPLTTPLEEVASATSARVFDARTVGTDAVLAVRYPAGDGTALVAEISLTAAAPQLQAFRFGDTGTATLVDTGGAVLIAGATERRNQNLRAPQILRLVTTSQPGQLRYYGPLTQRRIISTFEPIPSWRLGVLVDIAEREAFADLGTLALLIVGVVVGLVAVGLLGVVVIARRLATSERGLQQAHDAAERQALTDALTGLANRRAFDEGLHNAVRDARITGAPLAVTMLDLNRFKRLNDSRGHAAGDAALRAVANEITGVIRTGDLAARVGGDEFALLHADCTDEAATRIAARICEVVARLGVLCDTDGGVVLTVSAGSAQLADGMEPEDLVAAADVGLYRAKEQTRLVQGAGMTSPSQRSG
jgi:diguanylate cyclase (GGDEF)-like protein